MLGFERFDDLFRWLDDDLADLFGRTRTARSWAERLVPPVEVQRTDSELILRVELPGVDPNSVDVSVEDSTLRVRAERRGPTDTQGEPLRGEFVYGTFQRVIALPPEIEAEKMSARYDAGILEVRVPYVAPRAVKIPVEIGSSEQQALAAAS